jgi:hypothetical protein
MKLKTYKQSQFLAANQCAITVPKLGHQLAVVLPMASPP